MWPLYVVVLMAQPPYLVYGDLIICYDPRNSLRGTTEAMTIEITPAEGIEYIYDIYEVYIFYLLKRVHGIFVHGLLLLPLRLSLIMLFR